MPATAGRLLRDFVRRKTDMSSFSRGTRQRTGRAIAMMRPGFGGHPYGAEEDIAEARRTERVGDYVRPDDKEPP